MRCYSIVCILIILIVLFSSCKKETNNIASDLKNYLGEILYMPEQLEKQYIKNSNKFKNNLIILINSEDCTTCALQNINIYKLYTEKLKGFNTGVSLFSHENNKEKIEVALKKLKLDFPIIYYDNNNFIIKNKFQNHTLLNTFVINNEKRIIWIGSPIATEKTWDLFSKMMEKLQKN